MKRPYPTRIRRAVGFFLAAATLLLSALLIVQCADVYRMGISPDNMTQTGVRIHDIYSREIVAERFARISWAFVLWLAALALTLVLNRALPEEEGPKLEISTETRLALLQARVSPTPEMKAEEQKRFRAGILCGAVCTLCAAAACVYLLNPEHFASRDLETVMGAMLLHITPWAALAFAALLLWARYRERSMLRALQAAKGAAKASPASPAVQKRSLLWAGRVALYAAAILLLIAGILNGGMYDVLVKAINICTECIGLG